MAEDMATVTELQERLDWMLDTGEQAVAAGALADLSEDARYYGSANWDSDNVPRQIKSLVLRAAARFMRNPDGFTQSRAGDETVMWSDLGENAGTASFTAREQKMIAAVAGRSSGFASVSVFAYDPGTRRAPRRINPLSLTDGQTVGYAPTEGAPVPFFVEGDLG